MTEALVPKVVNEYDWYYRGKDLRVVHYDDGVWEILEGPEYLPVCQGFYPKVIDAKPEEKR